MTLILNLQFVDLCQTDEETRLPVTALGQIASYKPGLTRVFGFLYSFQTKAIWWLRQPLNASSTPIWISQQRVDDLLVDFSIPDVPNISSRCLESRMVEQDAPTKKSRDRQDWNRCGCFCKDRWTGNCCPNYGADLKPGASKTVRSALSSPKFTSPEPAHAP
jgi:hypothetical protein